MPERLTIIGGSVAGLVAALEAGRRGQAVDLYLDPSRIGGSFAGIEANGRRLDIGSRLFELDYENAEAQALPIALLDPARHTHKPFIGGIANVIRGLLGNELRQAAEPEMWLAGRRTRCVYMTVDLTDLPASLSPEQTARIAAEAHARAASWTGPAVDDTLHHASLSQHGTCLHELLVARLCAKQWAGWKGAIASERRKLWCALFHPGTIAEAVVRAPIAFKPRRPFHTTRTGSAHALIEALRTTLSTLPKVKIHAVPALTQFFVRQDGTTRFRFGRSLEVSGPSERTAIALSPEQLFAAAGLAYTPERIPASFLWLEVAPADLLQPASCLTICDPDLSPFRISPSGSHGFCVEFGASPPDVEAALDALIQTGSVREGAAARVLHRYTGPAQTAPSFANRDLFRAAAARFAALPFRGAILGGARRFGWDSLNDHIADGLQFGATRC